MNLGRLASSALELALLDFFLQVVTIGNEQKQVRAHFFEV